MSVFNPNNYIDNNINIGQILNEIDGLYLGKTGFTTSEAQTIFNQPLTINNSISANGLNISPLELSCLDGVTSSIQQQINSIGGGGSILGTNNIFTGTNQFNNDIIVNSLNISPTELSYINNLSSNVQQQITSTNSNVSTINSTLSTNGITSTTNVTDTLNYLQSQITNLPNGSGSGQSYFLTETTSSIDNQFKTISIIPANSTNQILTSGIITSTTPNQLMGQFITSSALNITEIPAGIYDFNFYANLTNNNLSSYLIIEVYKLSSTLTQTLLFTLTGADINSAVIIPYNINGTQPAFTVSATDYLMIKIFGKTTSTQNIIINIDYNSSNNYSHFHIPFILKSNHNDLLNIQGGQTNQYNHLTNTQLNNVINPASNSSNGYLISNDYNIFLNKQNLISPQNSAFNKNYETTSSNIKMNGVASVGVLDTISRADHIHATDTTLQSSINNLTSKFYQVLYVASQFGNDSNSGFTLNLPKKTIQATLNEAYSNTGANIIITPFLYPENVIIDRLNITLSSIIYEKGGLCSINSITINSISSSVRLSGLSLVNLTIAGNCSVYLDNCKISGILSKTGTGYLEVNNSALAGIIYLNSNSSSNFINNNITATISNSVGYNSSSNIFTNNLVSGVALNLLSGIWSFSDSVIYSSSVNNFSITANGIYLYLTNMSLINPDNTISKISLTNTYYAINSTYYNKSSSIYTNTTKINRLSHNEQINIDTILLNTDLNLNGLGSLSINELYTLDGISSNIQTQLNNTINLANNNTFTGTNTFNNDIIVNSTNISPTELSFINNVSSNIQIQLNDKVNLNNAQTLTNKSLNDCTANTQLSTDNSTKIATCEFVKLFSAPNRYVYRYLNVDMTNNNGFLFGPNNIYQISNSLSNGLGTLIITNKSGNSLLLSTAGMFNTAGGQILPLYLTAITYANNTTMSLTGSYSIYEPIQNITGFIMDHTNQYLFKYDIYYYLQKRPIINIVQTI